MRAPVFKAVGEPLVIEDLPDPTPGPGELVLKVGRCGICGTDLHMTDGHGETYPADLVIGHEFAGELVALGAGVHDFKVGDFVSAMPVVGCGRCASCKSGEPAWCEKGQIGILGGMGQYAIAKASAAIKLPDSLSLEDGALVEPLAVCLHGVKLAEISPGANVLVLGAGPIGVGSAYWAKRAGAGCVVVASRSRRGEAMAMALGADHFLLSNENLQEELEAISRDAPDVVFECSGAPGLLAQAVNLVRRRGTVVLLGSCPFPDTIYPTLVMVKQVRIQGSMVYSIQDFETVARSLDTGNLEPRKMVTETVNYSQLPTAFEALRLTRHQCKVMVDPWS